MWSSIVLSLTSQALQRPLACTHKTGFRDARLETAKGCHKVLLASAQSTSRGRKVIRLIRFQMKGLFVRFDREATGSPAIGASLEEFDPQKSHGESAMQDDATGLVARAGAVNDQVSLFRKQRRIRAHLLGCEPLCARDDDGISQQIQRLANIK